MSDAWLTPQQRREILAPVAFKAHAELADQIIHDLRAELDRLRRERDDARNQVEDVIGVEASSWMLRAQALKVELEKVEAERDELREDLGGVTVLLRHADAERDRYRAALEDIATMQPIPSSLPASRFAKHTLNGGTDD